MPTAILHLSSKLHLSLYLFSYIYIYICTHKRIGQIETKTVVTWYVKKNIFFFPLSMNWLIIELHVTICFPFSFFSTPTVALLIGLLCYIFNFILFLVTMYTRKLYNNDIIFQFFLIYYKRILFKNLWLTTLYQIFLLLIITLLYIDNSLVQQLSNVIVSIIIIFIVNRAWSWLSSVFNLFYYKRHFKL